MKPGGQPHGSGTSNKDSLMHRPLHGGDECRWCETGTTSSVVPECIRPG